jgi:mannose-6-phosphate isomerase-like protein (cupin superfamily)
MHSISMGILKDLLESEATAPAAPKAQPRNPVDHWTTPILLERAAYLAKLAKYGDGSAKETLREFTQHCVMLSFRGRDSDAEVQEHFTNIFVVLDGVATLVTGGTVKGATKIGSGEIRGSSIEGGTQQKIRKGDVVHIPAGQPHQMLVGGEKTVTCLVLKVQETLQDGSVQLRPGS